MFILKILLVLVVIGALILIHEFGHFIIAKKNGILVHEFALGMGPKIVGKQFGDTLYALRLFPIGGFVRMEGEDEDSDDPRAFNKKRPLQRMAVIFAGPFMNLVLAVVIYTVFFFSFPSVSTNTVGSLGKNYPAAQAGIQKGDKIVEINGTNISEPSDVSLQVYVNRKKTLKIKVERNKKFITYNLKAKKIGSKKEGYSYVIGIASYADRKLKGVEAVGAGFKRVYSDIKNTMLSFKYLITKKVPASEVSGPVGMGRLINKVADRGGAWAVFELMAFLSVNLGVLNLFPIPALDGSRILFILIEMVRGKPVDQEKETIVHFIGFVLLMALMVLVMSSDIIKWVNGRM